MTPLVSVIIPLFNSEKTILFSLKSIVDQKLKDVEIIIVNDGSTDNSKSLVENFKEKNPDQEIIIISQENQGVSVARNTGMKKAKGKYISFLDSDDYWTKNKLAVQLEIFREKEEVDFLGANRDGIILKKFFREKFERLNFITPKMLMFKNYFMTSSVIFKREVIKEVGLFKEGMNYSEDWEYFYRISQKFNCYLLNESLVYSVENKQPFGHKGLSARLWKMEKGELFVIKQGYRTGTISFLEYLAAVSFSLLKFGRRVTISRLRKI